MDSAHGPERAESARRRAAALAGHTGDTATARHGAHDPSPRVRVAALRSLARLGALDDTALAEALADAAPTVRVAALELAAARTGPRIDHLLHDGDAAVVEAAAWALGERPGAEPDVIEELSRVAGSHPDPLAREGAVAALGALGDEHGLPAVLAATSDKPAVRRRAVVALAAFDGPAVDAALAGARHDRDRQVRDAVDELLGPADDVD